MNLLGLDLGAEEAAVLAVFVATEDGDRLGGERVALETPLVADPGDGGKGRGHADLLDQLVCLGTTVMTL